MVEPTRHILLLAGRLGTYYTDGPLRTMLDRLANFGISAQILCISNEDADDPHQRIIECPGLGSRWQLALAVRRLRLGDVIRRPDLLHILHSSAAPAGLAIAEHWGLPYIQTVDEFLGQHDRLRLSARWCRGLVAVSRELARSLTEEYGVPRALITTIRPGINVTAHSEDERAELATRVPVIGAAGPLTASSGFVTFLGAARRVLDAGADVEFVIAGEGEDEVDLRRRAERLKITDRVTFAGHPVSGLDFWSVLDLFCQTSLVPTVGRSLAFAMASAVPSIASDVRGLDDLVVHDVTGLRFASNDSSALGGAIVSLLQDAERAQRLGRNGQNVILDRFHPDEEAHALSELYTHVLDREAVSTHQPAVSA